MTSTPDRRRPRRRLALALLALVAATPGGAGEVWPDALRREAWAALAKGDGIAAEAALRKALAAGVSRELVAARMGEALIDQGDFVHAREWLGPGRFAAGEAAHGWRMLGRLEMAERNLAVSDAAFARARTLSPDDSRLWVDIARLRYAAGQELAAVDAASHAVQLDPANVRALELRGLLVRDQYGLAAALPWFEQGLHERPDDLALLGEYAATLGELGRAREMLVVTRQMIKQDPNDGRAWFLQATLAARAGDLPLARQMLNHAGPDALRIPAGLLLSGVLELEVGDTNLAVERLDLLARMQPHNAPARDLLARALTNTGNPALVIARFADEVASSAASPYLLTLVARAYEDSGRRDLAAPLLDRAARSQSGAAQVIAEPVALGVLALRYADAPGDAGAAVPYVRKLLAEGNLAGGAAVAERIVANAPASSTAQALAADVRLLRGDLPGALDGYRRAAAVRLSDELMLRLVEVYVRAGDGAAARQVVSTALSATPRNRTALRLAAGFAAEDGNWAVAADTLLWLAANGHGRDARLEADLAAASARTGRRELSGEAARTAFRLQRCAPTASRALADTLGNTPRAQALRARADAAGKPVAEEQSHGGRNEERAPA